MIDDNSLADELLKLHQLKEKGVITEVEFNEQKAMLLAHANEKPPARPETIRTATERQFVGRPLGITVVSAFTLFLAVNGFVIALYGALHGLPLGAIFGGIWAALFSLCAYGAWARKRWGRNLNYGVFLFLLMISILAFLGVIIASLSGAGTEEKYGQSGLVGALIFELALATLSITILWYLSRDVARKYFNVTKSGNLLALAILGAIMLVVVVLLAIGGYFWFSSHKGTNEVVTENEQQQPEQNPYPYRPEMHQMESREQWITRVVADQQEEFKQRQQESTKDWITRIGRYKKRILYAQQHPDLWPQYDDGTIISPDGKVILPQHKPSPQHEDCSAGKTSASVAERLTVCDIRNYLAAHKPNIAAFGGSVRPFDVCFPRFFEDPEGWKPDGDACWKGLQIISGDPDPSGLLGYTAKDTLDQLAQRGCGYFQRGGTLICKAQSENSANVDVDVNIGCSDTLSDKSTICAITGLSTNLPLSNDVSTFVDGSPLCEAFTQKFGQPFVQEFEENGPKFKPGCQGQVVTFRKNWHEASVEMLSDGKGAKISYSELYVQSTDDSDASPGSHGYVDIEAIAAAALNDKIAKSATPPKF